MLARGIALLIVAAVVSACGGKTYTFAASAVALPDNYRTEFVHYATVARVDARVRDIYISPQAAEAARQGNRLPEGTVIVIEAYTALLDEAGDVVLDELGRYVRGEPLAMIHVAEKRAGWRESDFPGAARAGTWNFASYDFQTGERFDEDLDACFNCHNATSQTDFIYTHPLLRQYALHDEVQYVYCNLSGRIACGTFFQADLHRAAGG